MSLFDPVLDPVRVLEPHRLHESGRLHIVVITPRSDVHLYLY